jgi:hypothetical protein
MQEDIMNYKILALALGASAFGSFAASAQTTTIIEQRPGVVIEQRPVVIEQRPVVVEPAPQTTVTTQERGGFLGTESKTTTTTTGTGLTGDCATRTVHKQDLGGERTTTRTDCQ